MTVRIETEPLALDCDALEIDVSTTAHPPEPWRECCSHCEAELRARFRELAQRARAEVVQ